MQTEIPSTFKSANVTIDAFQHVWEPWLPPSPQSDMSSKLPPPFDAWGNSVSWKLVECKVQHEDNCEAFTLKACKAHEARAQTLLKHFNLVFGVTRNKQFAAAFRAKKAAAAEAEAEAEAEEEDEDEDDEEDESEQEQDEDEGDEEEVDEEEDDEQEQEQEQEEDEDDEESVASKAKDGSESESESESSIEEIKAVKKRVPSEKVSHARR